MTMETPDSLPESELGVSVRAWILFRFVMSQS
jgi:hypothetical protein